mmetsp:Transcript_43706/g.132958  ORF Transcript_43706/g.132958 Transcript_43706/m.132958 type:complete len:320 (-) Transcript_43706:448-1407(-)
MTQFLAIGRARRRHHGLQHSFVVDPIDRIVEGTIRTRMRRGRRRRHAGTEFVHVVYLVASASRSDRVIARMEGKVCGKLGGEEALLEERELVAVGRDVTHVDAVSFAGRLRLRGGRGGVRSIKNNHRRTLLEVRRGRLFGLGRCRPLRVGGRFGGQEFLPRGLLLLLLLQGGEGAFILPQQIVGIEPVDGLVGGENERADEQIELIVRPGGEGAGGVHRQGVERSLDGHVHRGPVLDAVGELGQVRPLPVREGAVIDCGGTLLSGQLHQHQRLVGTGRDQHAHPSRAESVGQLPPGSGGTLSAPLDLPLEGTAAGASGI